MSLKTEFKSVAKNIPELKKYFHSVTIYCRVSSFRHLRLKTKRTTYTSIVKALSCHCRAIFSREGYVENSVVKVTKKPRFAIPK